MTTPETHIATWGVDPVWAVWRDWAGPRGVVVGPYPIRAPSAVLVSPWDASPVEAVRLGVAAAGGRSDVWLVMTGPCAELAAEVLAAGGRGCLPRVPDDAALARLLSAAGWWPSRRHHEPALAAPSADAAPPPEAAEPPIGDRRGPTATFGRPEPPVARQWEPGRANVSDYAPAGVLSGLGWVARWRRAWPASRVTVCVAYNRGLRPRKAAAPDSGVQPAEAGPLLVLGPWPLAEDVPAAVLRDWLRVAHADPAQVSCLGCVPPPLGGQPHPAISLAAGAPRVAVVASVDWEVLRATRALIQALHAAGRPHVEVWLTGVRPTSALIKQVSVALQVTCMWVPPGAGRLGERD